MRIYIFFVILILGFIGAITAAVRPDIVEAKYMELRSPVDQYFAHKEAMTWQKAKDEEFAAWMLKLKIPGDCSAPKTSLRQIECKNMVEQHQLKFANEWNNKVQAGWKPYGIEN